VYFKIKIMNQFSFAHIHNCGLILFEVLLKDSNPNPNKTDDIKGNIKTVKIKYF